MFEQIALPVSSVDHLIEQRFAENMAWLRSEVKAHQEFMTRSISQRRRYLMEYLNDMKRVYL